MDSESRKEAVQKILVSVPDYMQKVQCDTDEWTTPFKCAVSSCRNFFLGFEEHNKCIFKFHNFPVDEDLRQVWKEQCGLAQNVDISPLKVCSDHFSLDNYIRNYKEEFLNPDFKRKLKPDAIPQKNLHANVSGTYSDTSNDGLLSFNDVKEAVDENEMLRNKYDALLKGKCEMMKKITLYEKKIALKIKDLVRLQDDLGKDWRKTKHNVKNKKNVVRKVFSDAQINLLLGKKRVLWSDDDLAKAFTLRHIGSKECYLYLKNQLNMPLPALACVQKWAASCNGS
ncbi:uncharacterized protein LOC108912782 isoform X2 [Anoplophora glabripennis]|uniref:uncharacterized protein LOC108912782 isoform X2 n=1 Tax=Anoplophora glabripennis TaxID=217634 RepID=UPI000874A9C4|nr:uncharacterized protein LOC108912782 isoform X2 [Anoplophora glabripennis]